MTVVVVSDNLTHIIPTRGQCFECHTNAANNALGLEASQLNKAIAYPNGSNANQLGALVGAGYAGQILTSDTIALMAAVDDTNAPVSLRARSYLHSNCSGCHRPGGPGSQIDLRIFSPLVATNTCDVQPQNGNLGASDARVIFPGDASKSVLVARMQTLDDDQRMPPVASQVVHEEAVRVVSQWINELDSCE